MMIPSLDTLVQRADALPSLPEVVRHVMTLLNDADADMDTLVHHINTDPAIVSRLLAAANASAFGLPTRVDSARQAFLVLGEDRVVNIILATALMQRYDAQRGGFDARLQWRHALAVATCARVLAERMGFKREIAFTGGLLHDIGQLLMFAVAPAAYAEVLRACEADDVPVLQAEIALFGYDHAAAGKQLAIAWDLPGEIADAIGAHHEPDECGDTLCDLVHVANVLAHALDLGASPYNQVPDLSERACVSLGLSWPGFAGSFAEIEARYQGMRLVLGI